MNPETSVTDLARVLPLLGALLVLSTLAGCQPRTPGEKAKDAVEDAAHETRQGARRAAERFDDATK
jgi:hypothetical protein